MSPSDRAIAILAKVGTLAYRLELSEHLSQVHSTFHVSNLKKCLVDEPLAISLDEIQIEDKLNFIEEPVEIMDREFKRLKQRSIPIIQVRCNSRRGPEFTWEREDQMKNKSLDATTLRELIVPNRRLIVKDSTPSVPRVAMPKPPRLCIGDLYDKMGHMEIHSG
ncbi:hypothetical protein Tco_0282657 [Tanacetum coccineum]